ncbi:uncharacterized protein Z519_08448 [Cladophialophora bantiana CBS 173.52]|uniref:Uncharacterized protein n=1 Tax=Cladophialophora bantiana (strain ATCC 10958 / CBS 173.52 / CDC B-1940 / NIH 8579) TaxID=1442370 RepID=A0A0D2HIT7_CLAB1|nr:uncharacterized protein Z519_08448 [Cladophialophora bantiana CBS 173.52]KIW90665.1 hypothetical protein Z519_08448 [Cladophialophora bantiana CBS 173.52]
MQILRILDALHTAILEALWALKNTGPSSSAPQQVAPLKASQSSIHNDVSAATSEELLEVELTASILEANSGTMLEVLYIEVKDSINGFYRMSILLSNTSSRSQVLRWPSADIAAYRDFDISHVRSRFPSIAPWLSAHIGDAITLRRGNLKYWERHHGKEAAGFDNDLAKDATRSKTVATTLYRQTDSAESIMGDSASSTASSGTSYAASLLEGTAHNFSGPSES